MFLFPLYLLWSYWLFHLDICETKERGYPTEYWKTWQVLSRNIRNTLEDEFSIVLNKPNAESTQHIHEALFVATGFKLFKSLYIFIHACRLTMWLRPMISNEYGTWNVHYTNYHIVKKWYIITKEVVCNTSTVEVLILKPYTNNSHDLYSYKLKDL